MEDCHWLDPLSHDLINEVGRAIIDLPVLLLLVVGTPGYSGEPNEEAAAIAEITRLGGRVKVDETQPGKPVVSVNLIGTQVTDARLVHIEVLGNLKVLVVHGTHVSDAGVKQLHEALADCRIVREPLPQTASP